MVSVHFSLGAAMVSVHFSLGGRPRGRGSSSMFNLRAISAVQSKVPETGRPLRNEPRTDFNSASLYTAHLGPPSRATSPRFVPTPPTRGTGSGAGFAPQPMAGVAGPPGREVVPPRKNELTPSRHPRKNELTPSRHPTHPIVGALTTWRSGRGWSLSSLPSANSMPVAIDGAAAPSAAGDGTRPVLNHGRRTTVPHCRHAYGSLQ